MWMIRLSPKQVEFGSTVDVITVNVKGFQPCVVWWRMVTIILEEDKTATAHSKVSPTVRNTMARTTRGESALTSPKNLRGNSGVWVVRKIVTVVEVETVCQMGIHSIRFIEYVVVLPTVIASLTIPVPITPHAYERTWMAQRPVPVSCSLTRWDSGPKQFTPPHFKRCQRSEGCQTLG